MYPLSSAVGFNPTTKLRRVQQPQKSQFQFIELLVQKPVLHVQTFTFEKKIIFQIKQSNINHFTSKSFLIESIQSRNNSTNIESNTN